MRGAGVVSAALLVVAVAWPVASSAQRIDPEQGLSRTDPVRGEFGLGLILAMPVGEFDEYVDLGGGVGGFGVVYVGDGERVGIRFDIGWIVLGSNTVTVPLSPTVPLVDVEVTTENTIGAAALGPQVVLSHGSVRPYLRAAAGFSYLRTTTSVEGTRDSEPFASTTKFKDLTFALTGGAGLRVSLAEERRNPIALDLGMSYVRNGLAEYLNEGGLREGPDGGVEIDPIQSETNLVTIHLGVTIGIR